MPEGSARVEAVALDAMGVIYPVADDLRDLLIPYLRSKGCAVPDEVIVEAFRSCYRDGAPAQSIWEASGRDWADGTLEREFLACYELNDGVIEFLDAMRRQSVPVYGLSNDVAEWARKRLARLRLDRFFAGWVFSSEVRAHKPQPQIYERLLELLPCPPGACVFVDDRAANLEAAQATGLQTVLFGGATAGQCLIPDFASLTAYVLDATAPRKTPDERGAP